MCGIVGYVGRRPVQELLLAGLEKLEYRGYDSAGISVIVDERIEAVRAVGNLGALRASSTSRRGRAPTRAGRRPVALATRPATTGIGHTRWATHGRVSEENAHPHYDSGDRVHVVVNGIVENYMTLKERLQAQGSDFTSETDAEVIAHLIAEHYDGDLAEAVRAAYAELEGHYAFVAMSLDEPEVLVGARKECPLIVGRGEGEQFVASAVPAFLAQTRDVQYVDNGEIVVLRPEGVTITDPDGRAGRARRRERSTGIEETAEKGGYETFMLKEIHEQADAVAETIADRTARGDGVDLQEDGALDEALLERRQADRDRRLRDLLPRRSDRPLRDRGVGAGAGRDGRRLGVPLPQPGGRRRRSRDRDLAVGRDRRHARGDAPGARARRDACSRSRT